MNRLTSAALTAMIAVVTLITGTQNASAEDYVYVGLRHRKANCAPQYTVPSYCAPVVVQPCAPMVYAVPCPPTVYAAPCPPVTVYSPPPCGSRRPTCATEEDMAAEKALPTKVAKATKVALDDDI